MTDAELLHAYAHERSEAAFRTLVDRYVRLVYSSCWRQLHDRHLAEDATQGIFVLLSQRAGKLTESRVAGWLLTAARYACANMRKTQLRRQRREEMVAMHAEQITDHVANDEVLIMLDEGLAQLGAQDREALVRRYLQEQPLAAVGEALGISEDAARKRVDRGLAKLRKWLQRRGVQTSSVALAALLAEEAKSAALPTEMQEVLTQGIIHACQTAAGTA
ncbi:MAG: RNA polymerase sigma factor, partial [Bacillota bacterium]